MTNYELKMPANYAAIDAEEMTYLVGGETTGWQMFKDIGTLFNYIARVFSAAGCQCCKPEFHRLLQIECPEILKMNGRHAILCNLQRTYNFPLRVGQHAVIKRLCQRQARFPNDRIAKRLAIFYKRFRIE